MHSQDIKVHLGNENLYDSIRTQHSPYVRMLCSYTYDEILVESVFFKITFSDKDITHHHHHHHNHFSFSEVII
jgi:hypothetical protein